MKRYTNGDYTTLGFDIVVCVILSPLLLLLAPFYLIGRIAALLGVKP